MATTTEEERAPDFARTSNPMPDVIIGGLIVVFILGTVLANVLGKKSPVTKGDPGYRAVVVPTADRPRTVVVPACATGVPITVRNARGQATAPGSTVVRLPRDVRPRVVLVPRCSANVAEDAEQAAPFPSSLFVLTAGARTAVGTISSKGKAEDKMKGKQVPPIEPRTQVIVPTASEADLVVVPACTGTGRAGRADALEPSPDSPDTLIAPRC